MQRSDRAAALLAKAAASFAGAVFILGVAAPIAGASFITSAGTVASSIGNGFSAYTSTSRAANLEIESDAYHGAGQYNTSTSQPNTTYLSLYAAIPGCAGTFSVSTQHRAYDPATAEYDFASSGAEGTC